MIRILILLTGILIISSTDSFSQTWKLIWEDEFKGKELDTNKWNIEVNGLGGGNNELQYYTNNKSNLRVENGILIIEAIKENYKGKEYTSGRINTSKKAAFTYGKIEARIKLPFGQGIWPAFWMLGENINEIGWPRCGEIDIMEMVGGTEGDKKIYSTLHWFGATKHEQSGSSFNLPNGQFSDDFHIFSTIWDEKEMTFYCDTAIVYKIDISAKAYDSFRNKFFILLNLAVGGNWPGSPNETTIFPQKMEVDYVRVYQKIQ